MLCSVCLKGAWARTCLHCRLLSRARTSSWVLLSCDPAVCDVHNGALPARPMNYQIYNIWEERNLRNYFHCNLLVDFRMGGGWTVKWQAISTTPLEVSCLNSFLFYTAVLILQTLDLDFCVFVASVALSLCPLKWVQLPRNVKSLLRRDHLATLSLVSGGLAPCFTQSCSPRCTFVNLSRLFPASRPGGVAARGLL